MSLYSCSVGCIWFAGTIEEGGCGRYGPDGSVQAITAASLEITQQKKAEQALILSEKLVAVGRLASSIAHEINNPLESVTNLMYLARNSSNMQDVQHILEFGERELRRVSAITNQTLCIHRQSTNPISVKLEELIEVRFLSTRAGLSIRM